jgi:hypothetical protein
LRTPDPNAIAYEVTAKRSGLGGGPFRICGRDFVVGERIRIDAAALTDVRREALLNADPRDLDVVEVVDTLLTGREVEAAAPADDASDDAPKADAEGEHDSAAHRAEGELGGPAGQDDQESGDDVSAKSAGLATSTSSPTPGRTKKKGRRA